MKIVLIKDLKGRGKKGDVIEVSDGYAQNYLVPNGFAVVGNSSNVNQAKQAKQANVFHEEQDRSKAQALADKISDITVTVKVKCGANGKIFGSVTNKEVADSLAKMGYEVDKKLIVMDYIRNIGTYSIKARLHPLVTTFFEVNVVGE